MLSRDTFCVLIVLNPRWSVATYFDSDSRRKKEYTRIKGVLDDAIEGYYQKGGAFENKAEVFTKDNKHRFKHVTEFPCLKQQPGSKKDALYALRFLKGYVRDAEQLRIPSCMREWVKNDDRLTDADLREDFHRIVTKLSEIIVDDVNTSGGAFNYRGRGRMYPLR